MSIADRFQTLRKSKGISQEELTYTAKAQKRIKWEDTEVPRLGWHANNLTCYMG